MPDETLEIGEVRQPARQRRLRPDRNDQYAVVACGPADAQNLPVFVDLDVLRELDAHAASNRRVELGGVLLGGQYAADDGRPFVIVTDSLRAEHHESTRSSFKFTHDTWARITEQRAGFPRDLQIVGWYHTHPGFGVFLSEMDAFICEHFFNKELDLALVIDPWHGERGWFQWSGGLPPKLRRLTGYYVYASRHRRAEVESVAASAKGSNTMASDSPRSDPAGSAPARVIQVGAASPPWLMLAVVGLLTAQFLVVALLAWRLFAGPVPGSGDQRGVPAGHVAEVLDRLDRRLGTADRARELDAQARVLERVAGELGRGTPAGLVRSLEQLQRENATLQQDAAVYRDLESKTRRESQELAQELKDSRTNEGRLREQIARLNANLADFEKREAEYRQQLAALTEQRDPSQADEAAPAAGGGRAPPSVWLWGSAALAALLAAATAVAVRGWRHSGGEPGDRAAGDSPAAPSVP